MEVEAGMEARLSGRTCFWSHARRHRNHTWTHPSVLSSSFSGTLHTDGSLLCKHEEETSGMDSHADRPKLQRTSLLSARVPGTSCHLRSDAFSGQSSGHQLGAKSMADCQTVEFGLEQGKHWCTSAQRKKRI